MNCYGIFVDYAQFAHKTINELPWNISVILTKNTIKTDAAHASPTQRFLGNERPFIRMNIYYRRYPCRHFFFKQIDVLALQWRHSEHDGVSNYQPDDCLLNLLFKVQIKKTSKFRVTDLYVGNSPVTVALPAQRASNAENVCFHLMTSSWVKHRLLIHSDITGYFAGFTTLWKNGIKGLISIHFIPTDFKRLFVNLRNIFFL